MKTLIRHKWKVIAAISVLGVVGCFYKMRRYTQPASSIVLAQKDNTLQEKLNLFKLLVQQEKQKIKETVEFVRSVLLETVPLTVLENRLNVTFEFHTSEELLLALAYVFTETILQRFVFLIMLAKNAIQYKDSQRGEDCKEMNSSIHDGNNKLEDAIFIRAVKEYISELAEKINQLVNKHYSKKYLTLTSDQAINLLTALYNTITKEYYNLSLKEGMEVLELESYHIKLVNEFTVKFKNIGDVKEYIESIYFQSLLLQGLDIDFYKLNAEYQKIIPLTYQERYIDESINNRDVVATILRAHKEYTQKRLIRYQNEIKEDTDVDYLEKTMTKFIVPELIKSQNEVSTSETYKKQLKNFIQLILT